MKTLQKLFIVVIFFAITKMSIAQSTILGNVRPGGAAFLGWDGTGAFPGPLQIRNNFTGPGFPIDFYTNNAFKARFTANNSLGGGPTTPGDGLRITRTGGPNLDMWASSSGFETHVQFHTIGRVEGANSQLRAVGNFNGLNLNASNTTTGIIYFSRGSTFAEIARFGTNNFFYVGEGAVNANNRVEIDNATTTNAGTLNGFPGGATGFSGLSFTDLTSASTAVPAGTAGTTPNVLSLDNTGKVILMQNSGGFGGPCSSPLPTLAADAGIDLNGNEFTFADVNGRVGIGTAGCFTPVGKLHVVNTVFSDGITVQTTLTGGNNFGLRAICTGSTFANTGVLGRVSVAPATATNIGVSGLVNAAGAQTNIGVRGLASGANNPTGLPVSENKAGYFTATSTTPNTDVYGVHATATAGGKDNYGGYFVASGGSKNYGVWAEALPILPCPPPCTTFPPDNLAIYANGDVNYTGTAYNLSDVNMKENIDSIPNALGTVMQLIPHKYNFKTNDYPQISLPGGLQYGLIAQEVESIIPELISMAHHPEVVDSLGNIIYQAVDYKTLKYTQLIPFLLKAIQEQQAQINSLMSARGGNNSTLPSQSATLASGAILYQNTPNPFGDETSIAYYLPDNVQKAQLVFFDMYGKEIKAVELVNKGDAKVDLTTSDLASGIYSYRLMADGQNIKTLQMVRAK